MYNYTNRFVTQNIFQTLVGLFVLHHILMPYYITFYAM